MLLDITEDGTIKLRAVFNGILLETDNKETMSICMRDTGFEFNYQGTWYEAKCGQIKKLESFEIGEYVGIKIDQNIKYGNIVDKFISDKSGVNYEVILDHQTESKYYNESFIFKYQKSDDKLPDVEPSEEITLADMDQAVNEVLNEMTQPEDIDNPFAVYPEKPIVNIPEPEKIAPPAQTVVEKLFPNRVIPEETPPKVDFTIGEFVILDHPSIKGSPTKVKILEKGNKEWLVEYRGNKILASKDFLYKDNSLVINVGDNISILKSDLPERVGLIKPVIRIKDDVYTVNIGGKEVDYKRENIKKIDYAPIFSFGNIVKVISGYYGRIMDFNSRTARYHIKVANSFIDIRSDSILFKIPKSSSGSKIQIGDIIFIPSKTRLNYSQYYGIVKEVDPNQNYLIDFGNNENYRYNRKFIDKVLKS